MSNLNFINLKIKPISSESFGVRSFCFKISTPDLCILLDPGCSLGPRTKLKNPHPLEFKRLYQMTDVILNESKNIVYIFISHFHHDHFKPNLEDNQYIYSNKSIFESIFSNKIIFCKDPWNKINYNQKQRGLKFISDIQNKLNKNSQLHLIVENFKFLKNQNAEFENEIGKNLYKLKLNNIKQIISINNTNLIFPDEFLHGFFKKNDKLIYVQPLIINYKDENFYFFSDVQGIGSFQDFEKVLKIKNLIDLTIKNLNYESPKSTIALSGPGRYGLNESILHLKYLIHEFNEIYIDHHLVRDILFPKYLIQLKIRGNELGKQIKLCNHKLNYLIDLYFKNIQFNNKFEFESNDLFNIKNILDEKYFEELKSNNLNENQIILECLREFYYNLIN